MQILSYLESNAELVQALATFGLIIVTAGLWWATKLLVDESRNRREDAKRPQILVKLKPNSDAGSFIRLVLDNVGSGAALNVRFRLEGDEDDFSKHRVTLRGTSGPINFISRGESEVYELGTTRSLFGRSPDDSPMNPFSILVEYEDVDGKPYTKRIMLDVRQFKGLAWLGRSVARRQMDALEKIAKNLENPRC